MTAARTAAALAALALSASAAPAAEIPSDGNFTVGCGFVHSLLDDPIVSPGRPGVSHMHDFFGNVSTSATSTPESLRAFPTRCRREADRSAYWTPALIGPDGAHHSPVTSVVYYTSEGRHVGRVRPFPFGFRAIARDPERRNELLPPSRRIVRWSCTNGSLAGSVSRPHCASGTLRLTVNFPECWDGRLDSPDHVSHVAYARAVSRGPLCPASHPAVLPRITMFVFYATRGGRRFRMADRSPYATHADFLNAWDDDEQALLVAECLNAGRRCFSASPSPAP